VPTMFKSQAVSTLHAEPPIVRVLLLLLCAFFSRRQFTHKKKPFPMQVGQTRRFC